VFSKDGLDAPVSAIAEQAGIGISGFYRRFPTKELLIETLALEQLQWLASVWEHALDAKDPWEGFAGAILDFARAQHDNPALGASLRGPISSLPQLADAIETRDRKFTLVMQRAKDAGVLRHDVEMHDIRRMFEAIRQMQINSEERYAIGWERLLAIVIDGMKPRADLSPLPAVHGADAVPADLAHARE
jgi:AcrR family transcriptional regulator